MKATLGLTGLTMNAMALIAPGALMWVTFVQQCQYGAPMAGSAMWFGIIAALALCFSTAISYAELSKLFPGAGSSYFFAEQAFLRKTNAFKFARLAKFVIGWASHLYYWIYPGLMVGTTAILVGYMMGQFFPGTFSQNLNSPLLMILFCIVFALGVSYIAYRGVQASTAVNMAINVIQISALLIFSVLAIAYRVDHKEGDPGWALVDGKASQVQPVWEMEPKKDADGKPIPKMENGKPVEKDGKPVYEETEKLDDKGNKVQAKDDKGELAFETVPKVSYATPVDELPIDASKPEEKQPTRLYHADAVSVVSPHGFSYIFIQASIAILILVGFECVTAMGEEARNAKRDVPRAVLLALFIQGVVCYLIQYFATNYFLHNNYTMTSAAGSSAPIADMMQLVGAWLFGSPEAGWWFMVVQAATVFLALIGTTLSCINTGARVTYAMGRDEEVPAHFGLLHGKTLTPHRAIWTLAGVTVVFGIIVVVGYACGFFVSDPAAYQGWVDEIHTKYQNVWYSFGIFDAKTATAIPNTLLFVALASNFGTFLLYMLTNLTAIVAFVEHHTFNTFKHVVVPVFGVVANLLCMLFYLIGPLGVVAGMSWKESYIALGIAAIWGIYGAIYFLSSSRSKGRTTLVTKPEGQLTAEVK